MEETIGFIGVGSMGRPMAANLLKRGYAVLVHDTDAAAVASLAAAGAHTAATPREVANRAHTVMLCLPTLDTLRDVALGRDGLLGGTRLRTLVHLSTAGPTFVRELAQAFAAGEVRVLDAPMSGGPGGAREATLSMMVSGSRTEYERLKPALDAMASRIFHVGDEPGQAQMLKLVNNMLSFAALIGSCEALALGAKAGLDADTMVAVINTGTGRNSATLDKFPRHILTRTFDYGASLAIIHKDISLCLEEAGRYGVPMWLGAMVRQVIDFAITQDGERADMTTIARHYERWSGVEITGAAARGRSVQA